MMQTWLMNKAVCPPVVRQEPDNTVNLLDVDFWLWYRKVMPKGMAHAFRIRFLETFNAPRTYDILTDNQYKLPNSNDGCTVGNKTVQMFGSFGLCIEYIF